MSAVRVLFSSQSLSDFIEAYILFQKDSKGAYSLRSLAREMGYKNPSLLSDISKGKRRPSNDFVTRLIDLLNLDTLESQYLRNLGELSSTENQELIESLRSNNKAIKEYFLTGIASSQNLEAMDLIIIEYFRNFKVRSTSETQRDLSEILGDFEYQGRIENLISLHILKQDGEKIHFIGIPERFELKNTDFSSLLKFLELMIEKDTLKRNAIFTSYMSDDDFKKAEATIIEAHRSLALLSQKSTDTYVDSQNKKIRVFTSHYLTV